MTLTERQTRNQKSDALRLSREMPQQLAIGLAIHQAIRSKEVVNFLHGLGLSVEYNRILRVETEIEKSALHRMEQNSGIFIPPDVIPGRRVFFADDNVDFADHTPDCKRTLHGTAMAIYQRTDPEDVTPELRLPFIYLLKPIIHYLGFLFNDSYFFIARFVESFTRISKLPVSISLLFCR